MLGASGPYTLQVANATLEQLSVQQQARERNEQAARSSDSTGACVTICFVLPQIEMVALREKDWPPFTSLCCVRTVIAPTDDLPGNFLRRLFMRLYTLGGCVLTYGTCPAVAN